MWEQAAAQMIGGAAKGGGITFDGQESRAASDGMSVFDSSGWIVNVGGAQVAGGVSMAMMALGAAVLLIWLLRKKS